MDSKQGIDMEAKADAGRAALLSAFVIPGAGQIYNRQWIKGLVLVVIFLLASLGFLIPITYVIIRYYTAIGQGNVEQVQQAFLPLKEMAFHLVVLFLVSVVLYIYSIFDAYKMGLRQSKHR